MYASICNRDERKCRVAQDDYDESINIFCGQIYISLSKEEATRLLSQITEVLNGKCNRAE